MEADILEEDLDYFQRRAETELEMAQRSNTVEATAAHYQLAEDYLARVESLRDATVAQTGEPGTDDSS